MSSLTNVTSSNDETTTIYLSETAVGIQSTAILLLTVASLMCNALVGYVLMKDPELLSHSSARKLLVNLTASSFLLSLTVFSVCSRFKYKAKLDIWRRMVSNQWISYCVIIIVFFGHGYVFEHRPLSLYSKPVKLQLKNVTDAYKLFHCV